jgi:hypothetical protein
MTQRGAQHAAPRTLRKIHFIQDWQKNTSSFPMDCMGISPSLCDACSTRPNSTLLFSVKPQIHYLNTDLEIVSSHDPNPLVAALTLRGLWLLSAFERSTGQWFANFEADNGEEHHGQPEPDILAMLSAIESLSGSAKEFWAACISRDFNIGYEGGAEPKAVEHQVTAATLARMTALGIALRITVYPAALPPVS